MGAVITSVTATALHLPLDPPIASALGFYHHVDCVVVHVATDGGPVGTGYSALLGGESTRAMVPYIEHELAPRIVGENALAPELLWERMWAPNKPRLRAGLGAWALSAIDIAIWDIVAKVAGLPLHTILGGYQNKVPVYGSGGWHTLSDAEMLAEAHGFLAQGITSYKFKTGTNRDRQRTALLRKELGDDIVLFADANQRFSVRESIEHARMLADYNVAWLEEPVLADSIDDLAEVAAKSPIPIAAGENAYFRWEFRELAERKAAAYLQPDIGRVGGVTEFRRVAAIADAFNLSLCSHLLHELSISMVGATPSGYLAEYADLMPADALTHDFPVIDGAIEVPNVPGHGVEFTPEALMKYRVH